MAGVTIYSAHRDVLDALITSGKVKSAAGATETGPFREQRDAYVLALAIGLARGEPTDVADLPRSKKDSIPIRDSVLFAARGAQELSEVVALLGPETSGPLEQRLKKQLERLGDEQLDARCEMMDRYAFAGFEWLQERMGDESGVQALLLAAVDELECGEDEELEVDSVQDPLLKVLLD